MNLFLLQFAGELKKLFARKRTYMGFIAFICIELAIVMLLQLPPVKRSLVKTLANNGYLNGEHYFSGLTLAFLILVTAVFFLGSLYLALVSGDIVSKEVEDGTMRMMLCRPISRFRLILVKYLACVVYTFALTLFIAGSALLIGLLYRGPGGMLVLVQEFSIFAVYEFPEGMLHYLLALPYLALSLVTVSSLGFLFSCLRMKPSTATILTLSIFFVDRILQFVPYLKPIEHHFVTHKMARWVLVFDYQPPWAALAENYVILAGVQVTLFIIAWLVIEFRDFKN